MAEPGKELSLSEVDTMFSSPLLKDLIHVYLTGGEPFLDGKIVGICEVLKRRLDATISLNTNGLLPKNVEKYGKMIQDLGLDILSFDLSINGPREVHDYVRGVSGSFDKLMQSHDVLEKLGIPHGWNFTIFKAVINYVKWFVDFMPDETHYLGFGLPKGIVKNPDESLFDYSEGELTSIYENCACEELRSFLNYIKEHKFYEKCEMGNRQIRIMPDGETYICDNIPVFHLGNMLNLQWEIYKKRLQEAKTNDNCKAHCLKEFCIYNYNNIIQKPINRILLHPFIYHNVIKKRGKNS